MAKTTFCVCLDEASSYIKEADTVSAKWWRGNDIYAKNLRKFKSSMCHWELIVIKIAVNVSKVVYIEYRGYSK